MPLVNSLSMQKEVGGEQGQRDGKCDKRTDTMPSLDARCAPEGHGIVAASVNFTLMLEHYVCEPPVSCR